MSTNNTVKFHQAPELVNNQRFQKFLKRPLYAWPTILLFLFNISLWSGSTVLGVMQIIPAYVVILINTIAVYLSFTVMHDAVHRAVSQKEFVNEQLGRISAYLFGPFCFKTFRYVHMQHHRFTNDEVNDPDMWCSHSNVLLRILGCLTIDFHYLYMYLKVFHTRRLKEKIDFIISVSGLVSLFIILCVMGYGLQAILFWLLPARIAIPILAYCFDYLPHQPHQVLQSDKPFKATSIRVGCEFVMNPLLLYQNYHLSHHLFPLVPFYHYMAAWKAGEDFFLTMDPKIVTAVGHSLSVDEYREHFIRKNHAEQRMSS